MINAIICGSCVVDLPCLTVDLKSAIGFDRTVTIDPIRPTCGGITCNVGISLKRLGMAPGILSLVGDDGWGGIVRGQLDAEGVEHGLLQTHPTDPTTAVAVLVDAAGERSFLAPGVRTATKSIDAAFVREHFSAIAAADWFVLGYFGRMPGLEPDLAAVLEKIRESGVRTVMDAGGDGGSWQALAPVLPHLDVFVPSLVEARGHTGLTDPGQILARYREAGARGLIGVKLGADGALLGEPGGGNDWIEVAPVTPPGEIVDSTGAGDAFVAGLIAGLDRGFSTADAGRLAAAAGACALTARGGHAGVLSGFGVWELAGFG
ncbi:MAG: sugar/nucleoside kinase (ribokinase family) [Verrucomicrobiales bacterium]|jgi:sugar/nucleoside kinase (ribokinase family)